MVQRLDKVWPRLTNVVELDADFLRVWSRVSMAFINRLVHSMHMRCQSMAMPMMGTHDTGRRTIIIVCQPKVRIVSAMSDVPSHSFQISTSSFWYTLFGCYFCGSIYIWYGIIQFENILFFVFFVLWNTNYDLLVTYLMRQYILLLHRKKYIQQKTSCTLYFLLIPMLHEKCVPLSCLSEGIDVGHGHLHSPFSS